jgi:hypothetical protein
MNSIHTTQVHPTWLLQLVRDGERRDGKREEGNLKNFTKN